MTSDLVMPVLVLGVVGVGFCVAYYMKKQLLWWAIIPGLGALTLLAAVIPDLVFGTDSKNDWLNVLVIAIGTALMAAVLKRPAARQAVIMVAAITLLVAIAMAPLTIIPKIVLIVAEMLVGLFLASRVRTR